MSDIVERLEAVAGFGGTHLDGLWSEAAAEIRRLREALGKIVALDVPRPVIARFRIDGRPSKYDRCAHTINMWDDCPNCISDYAKAVLEGKVTDDAAT